MKKIQLACLASLLTAGVAQASTPCDDFQIVIQNRTPYSLMSSQLKFTGALISPDKLVEIGKGQEVALTVSNSKDDNPMIGEFIFKTESVPMKNVHINFNLKNSLATCIHNEDKTPNPFPVSSSRPYGKVVYTIGG